MSETGAVTRSKRASITQAEEPPSRSTRAKTATGPDFAAATEGGGLFWAGYGAFKAAEVKKDSGDDDNCLVKLHYRLADMKPRVEIGSTGEGMGHAEVHAVTLFVRKFGGRYAEFRARGIAMECTGKTVCVRCAALLGLLGIQPLDGNTKKTRSAMGSTAWDMNSTLRSFLIKYLAASPDEVDAFINFRPGG